MNERIQELLEEAHRQTKGGIYSGHPSDWTEKFAKAIIQECVDIADEYDGAGSTIVNRIKKHFGVE